MELSQITLHCSFQGTRRLVKVLEAGGFFGEMALINHAPRAADCVASGKVKVGPTFSYC